MIKFETKLHKSKCGKDYYQTVFTMNVGAKMTKKCCEGKKQQKNIWERIKRKKEKEDAWETGIGELVLFGS